MQRWASATSAGSSNTCRRAAEPPRRASGVRSNSAGAEIGGSAESVAPSICLRGVVLVLVVLSPGFALSAAVRVQRHCCAGTGASSPAAGPTRASPAGRRIALRERTHGGVISGSSAGRPCSDRIRVTPRRSASGWARSTMIPASALRCGSWLAYAAVWEALPDDGLPRFPESRHAPGARKI
jgi:hypothetical protein